MNQPDSTVHARHGGGTTPAGRNLAEWFRQVDRYLRVARTFGPGAANAVTSRERALEDLMEILRFHAPVVLHCTPLEIWLRDEAVVQPPGPNESQGNIERRLPFLLYRDGIRSLTFTPETTREDAAALLDALAKASTSQMTNEDLVTLLWEADLTGLRVDVAPVEQNLRVRGFATDPGVPWLDDDGSGAAPQQHKPPQGDSRTPARTDFEDWALPAEAADPLAAWRELSAIETDAVESLRSAWRQEHAIPWTDVASGLVHEVLALDPGPDTRDALAHALVTWLGSAVQRCAWTEAELALATLAETDPEGDRSAAPLASVLQAIDPEMMAERLDDAEPDAQARFFALGVRIGRPALDLIVGVLAIATRLRLRAAATTALAYLCADDPRPLGRYLGDSRWFLVRNIVFVLGQIGGPAIVPMLAGVTRHADLQVRRAVVHALGQAPAEVRRPLLVELLESPDGQILTAALAMLARDPDARFTSVLLERVNSPEFEKRPDEVKSAFIAALGDAPGDDVVTALEQVLQRGGWFARRTPERAAAAQTLARLGTPAAFAVLQAGLQSRAEAVRSCCQEALARVRGRAA